MHLIYVSRFHSHYSFSFSLVSFSFSFSSSLQWIKIPFIWRSQRHNEINDRMDSAWRYIPIGRQLGECMGWHLQQSILAGDAAEQWLRNTTSHVSSKCCPSIFIHKAHRWMRRKCRSERNYADGFCVCTPQFGIIFYVKTWLLRVPNFGVIVDEIVFFLQPPRRLRHLSSSNTYAIVKNSLARLHSE